MLRFFNLFVRAIEGGRGLPGSRTRRRDPAFQRSNAASEQGAL